MIDADHRNMCKFADREEQGYKWVKADVEHFVENARGKNCMPPATSYCHREIELSQILRRIG